MTKFYLILCIAVLTGKCFGQTAADSIYHLDKSVAAVFVDEINATEIIYFSPDDKLRQTSKSILKTKVWKVVYANGEVETFNPPVSAPVPSDKIYLKNGTELSGKIFEITAISIRYKLSTENTERQLARNEVSKIVYSNGYTDVFDQPQVSKSQSDQPPKSTVSLPGEEKEVAVSSQPVKPVLPDTKEVAKTKTAKAEKVISQDSSLPAVPAVAASEAAAVTKPNEIVIKIQHENTPVNSPANYGGKPKAEYKNYVGFRFGGSMTSFYREKAAMPDKKLYNWEVGMGISLANSKYYNARLELVYANKGALEKFEDDNGLEITTRNKLTYFQGNLLPLILKTGAKKLNPVLGVGGYYAYLFKHNAQYKEKDKSYQDDELTNELAHTKFDYGLCAMLGFYNGHKPLLEFRYEYGLSEVIKDMKNKNHGLSVSLFLSF